MTQPEKESAAAKVELLEYTAEGEHGNAFLSSHTIPKKDRLWERTGVEMTTDLVFQRDETPVGHRGAKLTLPVKDVPADALKVLENTKGFKRVAL
jgi:hypothetical protein